MNCLNSLIVEGNVTQNFKIGVTPQGTKFANFDIACNRSFKNACGEYEQEVSFFNCIAYGKMAEVCESNLSKGRGVRLVGRLKQNRWTDAQGKKVSSVSVICDHIEFKPVFKKSIEESSIVENEDNSILNESEMVF